MSHEAIESCSCFRHLKKQIKLTDCFLTLIFLRRAQPPINKHGDELPSLPPRHCLGLAHTRCEPLGVERYNTLLRRTHTALILSLLSSRFSAALPPSLTRLPCLSLGDDSSAGAGASSRVLMAPLRPLPPSLHHFK